MTRTAQCSDSARVTGKYFNGVIALTPSKIHFSVYGDHTNDSHPALSTTEMKARHGSDLQPCSDFAIFITELSEGTMVKHKYIPLSLPFGDILVCRLFIP